MSGHFAIILHAHLPFVRHPEHARHLEERWLYEALIECYLPLLDAFDRMANDGVPFTVPGKKGFIKDQATREPARALAHDLMEEAFKRGLLLLSCGASTVRFCPPLVLTTAQVDEGLTIFETALRALL